VNDGVVRLIFPARAEFLLLPRLALAGIARGHTIDEETIADLKLAVTEAAGNAVRHAYADGHLGRVSVSFVVTDDSIVIEVGDDGVGMEPPEADEIAAGEGGMGLAIIGAIADEVEMRPASDRGGTLLTIRKSLR
jgi:serine/threonine-protein kinase RsbW